MIKGKAITYVVIVDTRDDTTYYEFNSKDDAIEEAKRRQKELKYNEWVYVTRFIGKFVGKKKPYCEDIK